MDRLTASKCRTYYGVWYLANLKEVMNQSKMKTVYVCPRHEKNSLDSFKLVPPVLLSGFRAAENALPPLLERHLLQSTNSKP